MTLDEHVEMKALVAASRVKRSGRLRYRAAGAGQYVVARGEMGAEQYEVRVSRRDVAYAAGQVRASTPKDASRCLYVRSAGDELGTPEVEVPRCEMLATFRVSDVVDRLIERSRARVEVR